MIRDGTVFNAGGVSFLQRKWRICNEFYKIRWCWPGLFACVVITYKYRDGVSSRTLTICKVSKGKYVNFLAIFLFVSRVHHFCMCSDLRNPLLHLCIFLNYTLSNRKTLNLDFDISFIKSG